MFSESLGKVRHDGCAPIENGTLRVATSKSPFIIRGLGRARQRASLLATWAGLCNGGSAVTLVTVDIRYVLYL